MIPCWWRGCVGDPRGIPNGASARDGFKLKVRGVLDGRMPMKVGDLVKVVFPYNEEAIGIFMGYDETSFTEQPWDDYPYDPSRAHVFWEGEIYSTPLDQIEVINESG